MGKTMIKSEVIFPPNDKKIPPSGFVWAQAEKAIVDRIGEHNKDHIVKTEALKAVLSAKENKDLQDAYVKVGPLDGSNHLVLRIKAKRMFKDYEDDHVIVKEYRSLAASHAEGQEKLQEFIQTEKTPPSKPLDTSDVVKNLRAMETHTIEREEGLKEARKFLENAKPNVVKMRELRRGGRKTLEQSRSLARTVLQQEQEFNRGPFLKGRQALDRRIDEALDKDPRVKSEVASFRKRASVAFDAGMRVMAEIRNVRDQVMSILQEQELEAEEQAPDFLGSDVLRLRQLEKLRPLVEDLRIHDSINKLQDWSRIEKLTDQGILVTRQTGSDKGYLAYKSKRDECAEAFNNVGSLQPQISNLQKRVALLLKGDPKPGEAASKAIYEVLHALTPAATVVKNATVEKPKFELLVKTCDSKWKELLGD